MFLRFSLGWTNPFRNSASASQESALSFCLANAARLAYPRRNVRRNAERLQQ